MECKASGNPVPSIYWTKKVRTVNAFRQSENFMENFFSLQSGSGKSQARIGEGPILTLEKVERLQSGVYQCTAENNVGEPVTVDMRLDVLCKSMTMTMTIMNHEIQKLFPGTHQFTIGL